VLLVASDPVFISFVERALTRPATDRITVTVADRLSTAIALLADTQPDVVLVDLEVPDSGGVDTLDRLSAHARAIPILIVTKMGPQELALACIQRGADDFILKANLTEPALRRIVRFAVERGRHRVGRQRDEQMRLILAGLPIAIWSTDTNLRITSSEGAALFGASAEPHRVVGMLLADFIGAPQAPELASARAALGGASVHYETELRGRTFETHQGQLRDDAGDVIGTAALSIDVTAKRADDVRLRETIERLRALRSRLDTIREEEGTRIARDIHDNVGQTLTAMKMDVGHVRRQLAVPSPSLAEVDERLGSMADLLDMAVGELRRVATELRPHVLDNLGIVAAIEWQLSDFEHRTGVSCVLASTAESIDMPTAHATAVYRIVQEALTNIMRHAAASHVDVRIWTVGTEAHVSVRDNGRGMEHDAGRKVMSLGLLGMRERAAMLDGDVTVASEGIGRGTTVSVRIPLA
jgi:two-component system sensor histidine kinase UhpB